MNFNNFSELKNHHISIKGEKLPEYETRYKFYVKKIFSDGFEKELASLNFFVEVPNRQGVQVENSWEIVQTFEEISSIFQNYLKGLTIDNLYRNYDEFVWSETVEEPAEPSNTKYKLILTDCLEKEKVLYSTEICGNDYLDSFSFFIPIWKDYEKNGVVQMGIRSHLKELFLQKKYTDRFKVQPKAFTPKNIFTVNRYETYL